MGLTPLAGLPMGTRAGDMDVGVIEYVANKYDRSISSVMEGLNKRSGMMGLSGVSSDFRDLRLLPPRAITAPPSPCGSLSTVYTR